MRAKAVASSLLTSPRYEVIPTASIEQIVAESVPFDVTVTVTASPTKGLEATLALSERLAARGYRVVPHVSARLVVDRAHLAEIVERLRSKGIDNVFVPAGDADPPAGQFDSSLLLLEALEEMGRPFHEVGITAYPQSHPSIDDDVTVQAMWDKRKHATYLVSNLCFDPAVLRTFVKRVRARGITLPMYVGIAGPVERTKLLNMATKIGVGESARFLSGHAGWFLRLGAPGGYNASRFLERGAGSMLSASDSRIAGVHIFTFNQVRETEAWRQQMLERSGAARLQRVDQGG